MIPEIKAVRDAAWTLLGEMQANPTHQANTFGDQTGPLATALDAFGAKLDEMKQSVIDAIDG